MKDQQQLLPLHTLKLVVRSFLSKGEEYNTTNLHGELVSDYLFKGIIDGCTLHKELQEIVDKMCDQPFEEADTSSLIKFIDDNLIPWWMRKEG